MPAPGMACPPQLWARRTVVRRERCKILGVCGVVCWIVLVGHPAGLPAIGTPLAQPAVGSRTVTRNQLRRFLVRHTSLWLGRLYAINPPDGCNNCHSRCCVGLRWGR